MAKRKAARKSNGAPGIQTVEGDDTNGRASMEEPSEMAAEESTSPAPAKADRRPKARPEPQANGGFGVGEIRKAAAFVNSVGGLDKAITLLQILKVAKEVQ